MPNNQDVLGREVRTFGETLDGRGSVVDTAYDAHGRVTSVSNPYFPGDAIYYTSSSYDVLGRVVGVMKPDGSSKSATYAGRTISRVNELGQVEVAVMDALGRQISVSDPQTNVANYVYDAAGRVISVIDTAANTTIMAYDIYGNKIAMSDPDMGSWSYSYNALGLLVEQTDAIGQVTAMTYDVLGRMLTRIDDANGANPSARTSTWTFDTAINGIGKPAGSSNLGYQSTPFYDAFGRLTSSQETIDGTSTYTVTTSYDAYSRPEILTYPSGIATKNVYNSYGHMSEVQYASSSVMLWQASEMDARGNITRYQLGNGAESTRIHDVETGWLSSIYSTHGQSVVQDLTYQFDDVGNLIQRADSRQGYVENAVYDNLNRVIQVNTTTGVDVNDTYLYEPAGMWTGTSTSIAVTYDIMGNITSKTDAGSYGYGQTHSSCSLVNGAVTQAGPRAVSSVAGTKNADYCYDANGNVLSSLDINNAGRTISWTAFGKPEQITKGVNTVDLAYGPDRARYKRIDTTATSTTTTHYAGGKLYEYIDRDGVLERKHYIGGFAVITTNVLANTSQTYYMLTDHLGSVDTIMDGSGAIAERMSFDPWGKRRQNDWVPITNPTGFSPIVTTRGFTGHEQLDTVGLVHMNGRVYDAEIGRFLSADPMVQFPYNSQGLNRYSYVLNNPLSFTDPTGFFMSLSYAQGLEDSYGSSSDNGSSASVPAPDAYYYSSTNYDPKSYTQSSSGSSSSDYQYESSSSESDYQSSLSNSFASNVYDQSEYSIVAAASSIYENIVESYYGFKSSASTYIQDMWSFAPTNDEMVAYKFADLRNTLEFRASENPSQPVQMTEQELNQFTDYYRMITQNADTFGILDINKRYYQVLSADTFLWNNSAFTSGINVEGHGAYDAGSVNNMYLGMMVAKYYGNGLVSTVIINEGLVAWNNIQSYTEKRGSDNLKDIFPAQKWALYGNDQYYQSAGY